VFDKDVVESRCFFLILDRPLVMSFYACFTGSTTFSKVCIGMLAMRIQSFFATLIETPPKRNLEPLEGQEHNSTWSTNHNRRLHPLLALS
jgi:hypothetical protein